MDYDELIITSVRLDPSKRPEVQLLGSKVGNASTVVPRILADSVTALRSRVSTYLSCQAGRRLLSSIILMHLTEYLSSMEAGCKFQIIPFDQSDASSMGPIVDFVISKGSSHMGEDLFRWPTSFCDVDRMAEHHFCAVFQTMEGDLDLDLIVSYTALLAEFCRRPAGSKALRACVTNGEDWRFFVFFQEDQEKKGRLLVLNEVLKLGDDLSGLPLLMGLLLDWVENCRDNNLEYCEIACYGSRRTPKMTEKNEEIFSAQVDVCTEQPGLQTTGIMGQQPRKKKRRRRKNQRQNSTNVESQTPVDSQGAASIEASFDGSELITESLEPKEQIPKGSRKRVQQDSGLRTYQKAKKSKRGNND